MRCLNQHRRIIRKGLFSLAAMPFDAKYLPEHLRLQLLKEARTWPEEVPGAGRAEVSFFGLIWTRKCAGPGKPGGSIIQAHLITFPPKKDAYDGRNLFRKLSQNDWQIPLHPKGTLWGWFCHGPRLNCVVLFWREVASRLSLCRS